MRLVYLADIRFPMERANGIQTVETCHALAREGVDVELVVRRTDERSDRACLEFFGLAPHERLRLRRLRTPLGRVSYLAGALASMSRRVTDVIYTRDLLVADLAVRLRRGHGVPVFYEAHTVASVFAEERAANYEDGAPPSRAKLSRLDTRERRVCTRANGVATITKALRDALKERYGTLAPTRVVPDGCRVPSELPLPAGRPAIPAVYYIGQLYPWKGVDVAIRAMQHVSRAELVVIGGLPPEPDLDRVRSLAAELSLADRVHFLGFIPPAELDAERKKASLFVIPNLDSITARRFTSPLKLFEAMASGRPLVASDLPSFREVLAHETNALLVPAGDAESLAEAIERLLSDPALAERLAARAFEDVKAYSWERRARAIAEFCRESS
jgi:glycosyltransferase involved in cell wall biosynthesis